MIDMKKVEALIGSKTYEQKVKRKTKTGIKVYKYQRTRKGTNYQIFTKEGKVHQKAWDKFINDIKKLPLTKTEIKQLVNEAQSIRNEIENKSALYSSVRQGGWNRIDVKSMISRLKAHQCEKFLYNMGLTPEEVAAEYDLDPNMLLDETLWNKDTWSGTDLSGNKVVLVFTFDYNGLNNITRIE